MPRTSFRSSVRLAATVSHAADELDDPTFGVQLGANFDLCDGHPSLPRMGPTVGLGARTLQRSLAARDLVFRTVVEQVRRRVAAQYLAQSDSCLTEIACLLGYSQVSAFSASCAGIEDDLLGELEDDLAALVVHDVVDVDQGLA
jgi:AraC-like DNA-binding protein